MKAIQVKYLRATNSRGARFKISAEGVKSVVVPFNYREVDHGVKYGVYKFCRDNDWSTNLVSGQLPNGDYVFCFKNQ